MQFDIEHITSLFENATEGFVITDSKATIIIANPSACRMFGYTLEELLGRKIEILIPPESRPKHIAYRDEFYTNPGTRVMGHGRDLYGQRKDAGKFPVEVSLSSYIINGERYATAFIIDITHRKSIEQNVLRQQQQLEIFSGDLKKLNAELEIKVEERTTVLKEALQKLEQSQQELSEALDKERELNEIKGRFVSMASHEFRTPLSTVLSSASLLGKYTGSDEQDKRDRHIEKIRGSVKHLNNLLEDFLSLGKLDEGKVGTGFQEFDLEELLQDTVDYMQALAKKGQQLIYSHTGEKMLVSDPVLLKNALINLVSNAIKFSAEEKTISIQSDAKGQEAVISVKDEGIGISPADKIHLFSTFFRGKNAVNIQGTGLGLHIVKRYLDLLGGNIQITSEEGRGTTATIIIPSKKI